MGTVFYGDGDLAKPLDRNDQPVDSTGRDDRTRAAWSFGEPVRSPSKPGKNTFLGQVNDHLAVLVVFLGRGYTLCMVFPRL